MGISTIWLSLLWVVVGFEHLDPGGAPAVPGRRRRMAVPRTRVAAWGGRDAAGTEAGPMTRQGICYPFDESHSPMRRSAAKHDHTVWRVGDGRGAGCGVAPRADGDHVKTRQSPQHGKGQVTRPAHKKLWSGQRDSNPRMTAWEAVALPLGDARIYAMKLA